MTSRTTHVMTQLNTVDTSSSCPYNSSPRFQVLGVCVCVCVCVCVVCAGEGIGVGIASCAVTEIQAENDSAIFIMWHAGSPWRSSPFPASQMA